MLSGVAMLVMLLVITAQLALAQPAGQWMTQPGNRQAQHGAPQRQLLQPPARPFTGLLYEAKGMRSPPNATRRSYVYSRLKRGILSNLGAGANTTQIARAACGKDNVTEDPACSDVLLLALTPDAYNSNNTADTPGGLALISPAQDQGNCAVCVGFAVTAAAEAAVNVYKQRSWQSTGLSESDLSFCKLVGRISCETGSSYDSVVASIGRGDVSSWAARTCYGYNGEAESCFPVSEENPRACKSQLPAGGVLSVAYDGNALDKMAKVKEQIMLNGGVLTSLAMSDGVNGAFKDFKANKTAANGAFSVAEDLRMVVPSSVVMHAVFCYGWWDNPVRADDGYWICKNSWGSSWGLQGSFRVAYAAANIMQPDYTFALQYNTASMSARAALISRKLRPNLSRKPPAALNASGWKPECLAYSSKDQQMRLIKLADDINTLALTAPAAAPRVRRAEIIFDLVASNLGYMNRSLSAASTGPFLLCGKTARLLRYLLLRGPPPAASPAPSPSPSPGATPSPAPSPSPKPNPGGVETCTLERAADPVCSRCVRDIAISSGHTCVLFYDASVACVGAGNYGQLGDGWSSRGRFETTLVAATALSAKGEVSTVGVADSITCVAVAAADASKVYCVGSDAFGTLGSGNFSKGLSNQPVAIQGLKQTSLIRQVVGTWQMCASYAGTGDFDTVQCWGDYYDTTPIDIGGTSGTVFLAGNDDYFCALLSDSTVSCWMQPNVVAVPVAGISNAVRVAAGAAFGCAVTRSAGSAGLLWCWGKSAGVSNSDIPWRVDALEGNVLDVAAGINHVCAVVETSAGSGDVYCWGDNTIGQLGQGNVNSSQPTAGVLAPVRVKGISKVTALFAAYHSTCALTVSQRVVCWGMNLYSQLGGGTPTNPITLPQLMKGLCA